MSVTSILSKLFGNKSDRDLREIKPIVDKIEALSEELKSLTPDELRQKIAEVRADIRQAVAADEEAADRKRLEIETLPIDKRQPLWDEIDRHEKNVLDIIEHKLDEHLPVVFATMRETAARFAANPTIEVTATDLDRELAAQGKDFLTIEGDKAIYKNQWMAGGNMITWDMVHYHVQLIGGVVLHQGKIAEMATGEGKTLVATLPVFLRSLSGKGVHVVTVNDYLSKRDSEWMGPLYMFHGSTVDCIDKHQPNTPQRRAAYNCDITFGTNNEFGFDYLRDNMAMAPDDMVQRKHYYAIVDEVDSVLIDDARTPLIISGPVPKGDDQLFNEYKPNVEKVVQAQRKLVNQILADAKTKLASDDKDTRKEGALLLFRAFKGLPKNTPLIRFLSQEGMKNILLETEAYLSAGQLPRDAEGHGASLLRHRREEPQRRTDRQRYRCPDRHSGRPHFLRAPRHSRRTLRSRDNRRSGRTRCKKRRSHAELCRQGRTRPHRHSASESLHPFRKGCGIRDRRQQDQDSR